MGERTEDILFRFNQLVLQLLWQMDTEATPVEMDYPTGLWWYSGHLDRSGEARKVQNSEVCWSHRIANLLNERGLKSQTEVRYPDESRRRCGVVDVGLEKPLWLEVKSSYRAQFDTGIPNQSYANYLASTALDVDKLCDLTSNDAGAIALLLVGFDQAELPIEYAHLSDIEARIAGAEWHTAAAQWHVSKRLRFRTRCWIWSRSVAS